MELIPTQEEVVGLLQQTSALRPGYFTYPNGLHCNQYLQVALAMRYAQHAKTLSVALSRIVRANPELRAMLRDLSIVAPATGGLPVAYGVCEALRARQVYWAEREEPNHPLQFRQFLEPEPGEKILLVDDILRTGSKLKELKAMVDARGADVVGLAVMIFEPTPRTPDFAPLPFYYLTKLDTHYFDDDEYKALIAQGAHFTKVRV